MIKQYVSLLLITFILIMSAATAADDPMVSLFLFQQKMAKNGSSSAMLKMGEMYERGDGTEKSYDKALEMYQKAKQAGNAKADQALKRLKNSKKQKKILTQEKLQKKKAKARAEAKAKAEAARIKAEKAKAIAEKIKAKQKKTAAAKRKAAKEARIKAIKLRERLAREKAEKEKANKLKEERAKAAAARVRAAEKRKEQEKAEKGAFKSDPCKGKAARLLSICR